MSRGGVSGVNVLVFCDKHRSRDMRRQNALGITGVYTSRNTDNAVFVIRAEPSQKKKTFALPGICLLVFIWRLLLLASL